MGLAKQKILVTGADGFIGSHLVEGLLDKGCQVRAFVFYNSFNSWGWLDTFPKEKLDKIDVFAGDIQARPVWTLMPHLPMYSHCQSTSLEPAQWLEDRLVNIPSSVRFNI